MHPKDARTNPYYSVTPAIAPLIIISDIYYKNTDNIRIYAQKVVKLFVKSISLVIFAS